MMFVANVMLKQQWRHGCYTGDIMCRLSLADGVEFCQFGIQGLPLNSSATTSMKNLELLISSGISISSVEVFVEQLESNCTITELKHFSDSAAGQNWNHRHYSPEL